MSHLSDSDSSLGEDEVVFTVQEVLRTGLSILHYGLSILHYTKKKIRRAKRATNLDRFKGHYKIRRVSYSCLPLHLCVQSSKSIDDDDRTTTRKNEAFYQQQSTTDDGGSTIPIVSMPYIMLDLVSSHPLSN